jgi:predicted GH43/DUF377 family glycosyl hydrolase
MGIKNWVILIGLIDGVTSFAQHVSPEKMQAVYEEVKTPYKYGLVLTPATDSFKMDCPTVFRKGRNWYMTYVQFNGAGYETWLAKSKNLLEWKTLGRLMSFSNIADPEAIDPISTGWDAWQKAGYLSLLDPEWGGSYSIKKVKGKYWMSYFGGKDKGYEAGDLSLGIAYTTKSVTKPHEWKRLSKPVLTAHDSDTRWWENKKIYKSSVVYMPGNGTGYPYIMYYNANGDTTGNKQLRWFERIGMAGSNDMETWHRIGKEPVMMHSRGITGDAMLQKIDDLWVMFYFGAFWEGREQEAFNRFACSYDGINWTDWTGDDLVKSTESFDGKYAHKSYVLKFKGIVYHFYNAVNSKDQRGIAVATSKDLGKSEVHFYQSR